MADQVVKVPMSSASDRYLALKVQDDANNRFELQADGQMDFGNGTDAPDVVVKRIGTGVWGLSTGNLAQAGVEITATAAELNQLDVSATGGALRVAKIAFGAAELGGSETNTSFTFPANGAIVKNVFIYVADGESGTMDVGTQGTSNDPDGLLDGISLTNTGWVFPAATHTTGLNADYLSASTYGALWMDVEIGSDSATDIGYAIPKGTFITGADPVSITSSGNLDSCSGYLFIEYIELPSVA